jgi:tripartite-type tricarboxylate transporter receptor subunit TctC
MIACDNFSSAWEQVQAGKIRALAITAAKRYSFSPDIPTGPSAKGCLF